MRFPSSPLPPMTTKAELIEAVANAKPTSTHSLDERVGAALRLDLVMKAVDRIKRALAIGDGDAVDAQACDAASGVLDQIAAETVQKVPERLQNAKGFLEEVLRVQRAAIEQVRQGLGQGRGVEK
ncbi:TPA: hypothetical protein DCL30_01080 [Candidatus Peribacteria bacterium]|nr:MAG: hypothetical protein A3J91_03120 [Candidatus Peribacteria bacterium RIFOXYC2_FULL_58_10]OGJ85142.1 MAG: hypothetical protein A2529_01610 [Candidatus Peribacteria bacterium RIFOXYD2_FULL_58_15]HAI98121.1 hypothetical protein [Candidatus Peribacteria bacterium]HAS33838.1 hypothetical protein [Candidatus Peribacteria bacterium]